jgi:hypothetical protein
VDRSPSGRDNRSSLADAKRPVANQTSAADGCADAPGLEYCRIHEEPIEEHVGTQRCHGPIRWMRSVGGSCGKSSSG